MPSNKTKQLDSVFHALADPTRRAILTRVAGGERNVSELAEPFDMSLAAVSKHLKVLERAGLLARRQEGRVHHLQLDAAPLAEAAKWISFYQKFWGKQLDSLGEFLKKMDSPATDGGSPGKNEKKGRSQNGS